MANTFYFCTVCGLSLYEILAEKLSWHDTFIRTQSPCGEPPKRPHCAIDLYPNPGNSPDTPPGPSRQVAGRGPALTGNRSTRKGVEYWVSRKDRTSDSMEDGRGPWGYEVRRRYRRRGRESEGREESRQWSRASAMAV